VLGKFGVGIGDCDGSEDVMSLSVEKLAASMPSHSTFAKKVRINNRISGEYRLDAR